MRRDMQRNDQETITARRRGWAIAVIAIITAWATPAFSATVIPHRFSPGTPARASQINENFDAVAAAIDTVSATLTSRLEEAEARVAALESRGDFVPPGTIAFFATSACPSGWSQYTAANGRYIVAASGAGAASTTVGPALADGEDREHTHSIAHRHAWARTNASNRQWFSYTSPQPTTSEVQIYDWGSGIGNNSGRWPLAYESSGTLYTGNPTEGSSGAARTGDVAPYIQLRACQKD